MYSTTMDAAFQENFGSGSSTARPRFRAQVLTAPWQSAFGLVIIEVRGG